MPIYETALTMNDALGALLSGSAPFLIIYKLDQPEIDIQSRILQSEYSTVFFTL